VGTSRFVGHPVGMATKRRKVWRVLAGIVAMLAFVAVVLAVLVRQAGEWRVPYFSFTSAHGSRCTNDFTGYTCEPLTLADVEFFGDVDLPDDTQVLAGRYRSTHDYQLTAQLSVPPASAGQALKGLRTAFGGCRRDVSTPLRLRGLRQPCAMASEDGADESGEPSSRLYAVGTGLRKDGTRLVGLTIRSR
jgi:hypothetical protein